jgi:anti-sigma-K factor RskA
VPHCDEETLSLLALGEPGSTDVAEAASVTAHVAQCPRCAAALAALRHVVIIARSPEPSAAAADASTEADVPDAAEGPDAGEDPHVAEDPHARHGSGVTASRAARPELSDAEIQEAVDAIGLDEIARIVPPPPVWAAIAAATGVGTAPRPDEVTRHADTAGSAAVRVHPTESSTAPAPPPSTTAPASTGPTLTTPTTLTTPPSQPSTPSSPPAPPSRSAPPVPRQRPPASRLNTRVLAVAASCLIVGLLGGVIADRLLDRGSASTSPSSVLAATTLAGLPAAPTASGKADVVETSTGRTLDLDVRKLGAPDGFYQVWVIDPTVTKMVPVGVLSGGRGRFVLPAGVDLADYPVVDVSLEPLDGNPAHSGKSVLRGTLR